jgi:hypothetical protein
MSKALALTLASADYARWAIVLACAGALILAGQAFPL